MFHRNSDRVTTALLLAAGTGSRLQPLTDDAPKCLTEVNGTTILERLVDGLRQQGFKRLVVVVGYLGESIREFLADHAAGLTVDYVTSSRYRTTNNLYSLWLARKEIHEPFLLVECDLVFDASLPVFAGHFPDRPLLPGFFQIELARVVAERACGRPVDVVAVKKTKFARPVLPGEELRVEETLTDRDGAIHVKAVTKVNGELAASVSLTLALSGGGSEPTSS